MFSLRLGRGLASFVLISSVIACDESGSGARTKRQIEGRVSNLSGSQAGSVEAHEVDSSGQPVEESSSSMPATTDSSGSFTVDVQMRASVRADVVVEAVSASGRRAVLVTSDFASRAAVVAEPMTDETTLEADVFVELLANGELCDGCLAAHVEDWIGANASAEVAASGGSATTISAIAEATADATASYYAVLHESASSASSFEASLDAQVEARLDRAAALHAASTDTEITAAEEAYVDLAADAYAGAGVDANELATAAHAAAESACASIEGNLAFAAGLEGALVADVEARRAAIVTATVEAHAQASGAAVTEIANAGATLRASIDAAAAQGANARTSIDAAWSAYRASVEASLRASVSAGATYAFDSTANAIATAAGNATAAYKASIGVALDAFALVAPLMQFTASTDAHVSSLVAGGIGQTQAAAMVDILVAIDLAAN